MTTPIFRRAELRDLPTIIEMLADDHLGTAREELGTPLHPAYLAAFHAIDADPNQLLLVMEEDGEIVGSLQLSFLAGLSRRGMWRGLVEGVRVASGQRGAGRGRAMLEWTIAECRRRGCGLVQLTSHKSRHDALRFYDDLGFKRSHEGMKLDLV
jgi:GNAT superfamily N-acetyltransferase